MKRWFFVMIMAVTTLAIKAQTSLPPVWQAELQDNAQHSSRCVAYISPARIVWQDTEGDASVENLDNLLGNANGQAELTNANVAKIKVGADSRASFVLDFGKELHGGIQVVTGISSHKEIRIRVRFGESVSESMSELVPEGSATNDHAIRDFYMTLPWLGVAEAGNSGFRFVRIDVDSDNVELALKEIRAVFTYRDIPYLGSFKSDNERLNDIWMTGAYTVHLNMQEYLWDGIKRDRLVWVGDMHPELMTINSVFGYNEVVPKSLNKIRDITPIPNWMNGFSSYSIWWLLIQRDWYYHQGDMDYLMQQKDYISSLLGHLMSKIDDDGKENLDGVRFLDWPSSENEEGVSAGLQALMVMAMDAGDDLSQAMGDADLAKRCRDAKKRLMKYVPDHNGSKQAAALMALSGLMKPKKANKEVISVDGAKDFSTFYGYYMLEAMAAAGDYQGAMDIINEYWGAMLDLGATTFWEDFDLEWMDNAAPIDEIVPDDKVDVHATYGDYCYKGFRHSLCHGWASGPTAWLSRHVLGIKILEPGCKTIKIEPQLGELKWVEGSFPTPYGVVHVRHEKNDNGKIYSEIQVPDGITLVE